MTNTNKMIELQDILDATLKIKGIAKMTPVLTCESINKICNAELFFKCENFQKVGAFKFRGALNAVLNLSDTEKSKGVATHSSGNHAQALSLAAKLNNIKAYIVMPSNSSKVKVKAVESYGGIITFCEPTLEARETTLKKVIARTGAFEIHPYDNRNIIAGQATAAKELIEKAGFLDYIIAPVGGGGLLSGTALSTHYLSPETKVIAAEPEMANDAYLSFHSKKFIPSVNPQTIADGLRTSLGDITFPIILKYVSDVVTVKEQTIVEAMMLVWERMKIIIEPSSAVTLACLLEKKISLKNNQKVGIIISGGNVDLDLLSFNNLL